MHSKTVCNGVSDAMKCPHCRKTIGCDEFGIPVDAKVFL